MTTVETSRLKVHEIAGPEPGPTVTIIAGGSPTAHPGIEVCWDLVTDLAQAITRGQTRLVPVLDVEAFFGRAIRPYFGDGAVADLGEVVRDLVGASDFVVDMRGGDLHRIDAHWIAAIGPAGHESEVEALTERIPADFRLHVGNHSPVPLGVAGVAAAAGVPSLIVSAGGLDRFLGAGSQRIRSSVLACLHLLGVTVSTTVASRPGFDVGPAWWAHDVVEPCLWLPVAGAGDRVLSGELLGRMIGPFGEPLADVRSPFDGWVLSHTPSLAVGGGDSADGTWSTRTVTVVAAHDVGEAGV